MRVWWNANNSQPSPNWRAKEKTTSYTVNYIDDDIEQRYENEVKTNANYLYRSGPVCEVDQKLWFPTAEAAAPIVPALAGNSSPLVPQGAITMSQLTGGNWVNWIFTTARSPRYLTARARPPSPSRQCFRSVRCYAVIIPRAERLFSSAIRMVTVWTNRWSSGFQV